MPWKATMAVVRQSSAQWLTGSGSVRLGWQQVMVLVLEMSELGQDCNGV